MIRGKKNQGIVLCLSFRAVGNMTYGSAYREKIVDKLRKAAEQCDCLQCFFLIHSMGGGKALIQGHPCIMLHSPVLQALLQLIHVRFVVTKQMNKANKNTFVHDFISLT